jgi:type II secretory pathway pseudopilin PulG
MSRAKYLPPAIATGAEAMRQVYEAQNRNIAQTQPFHIAPTQSATFTVSEVYGFYPVDASAGSVTANLPPAAAHKSKRYAIKKVDSSGNAVVIDGADSETIDGATTVSIATQYVTVTVVSDGTQWWIE